MVLPLKEKPSIEERLTVVEKFFREPELSEKITEHLHQITDLERLISKVAVGRINPREMLQLKRSLLAILPIKELVSASGPAELKKLGDQLNACGFLLEKIGKELKDDAPMLVHQGGIIKEGVNVELDELRAIAFSGKDYLLQIQKREVGRTGINSLKISYNKVFGYYLEVSNANKEKVPADWIRKQTLVNAERYITEELKVYEEKILHAEERLTVIEQKLFQEMVIHAADFIPQIQQNARVIAMIDCLLSFAAVPRANRYTKR